MYVLKDSYVVPMAAPGTVSLTSTGVATPTYAVISACAPNRLVCVITTAASGTTAASVQFIARPTPGSSSGQVVLGTVNIPNGASIGQAYYKDITDVANIVNPGTQLVFNVSAAIANAGAVVPGWELSDSPVNAKAVTAMVASS